MPIFASSCAPPCSTKASLSVKSGGRGRRTAEVQDVLRLPGASQADPLASHARYPPRRGRNRPLLPYRTRSATPAGPYQEKDPQTARRLDSPLESRSGRRVEAPAQQFHYRRRPPGTAERSEEHTSEPQS